MSFRHGKHSSGASVRCPPPQRHTPWRSTGDVTIPIFEGRTDAMPPSRLSASLPLLSFFFSLLSLFPSSSRSICYKSMDTHLHPSQRQALAPNCASASGDSVQQGAHHPILPPPPVSDVLQSLVASSLHSHCRIPARWTSRRFSVTTAIALVHNSGTPSVHNSSRS